MNRFLSVLSVIFFACLLQPSPGSAAVDLKYEIISLGTLGGDGSVASGLNNFNEVVGGSDTSDGKWHAFFWKEGKMTDLGVLAPQGNVSHA